MPELHPDNEPLRALLLLSGAGVYDGSEIHEATLLLLALTQAGYEVHMAAPDILQENVIDHVLRSCISSQPRNVLSESARIARGKITSCEEIVQHPKLLHSFHLLALPGGFGVATILSNYATHPHNVTLEPSVYTIIRAFLQNSKPCIATCIAPVLVASVAKDLGYSLKLTLGMGDKESEWLRSQGMKPIITSSHEAIVDETHKVITTPAYMNKASIQDIWLGIEASVKAVKKYI